MGRRANARHRSTAGGALALNAIDLFSGCAGLALGLQRLCNVLLYCDSDEDCRQCIRSLIRKGELEAAKLEHDVRKLDSASLPRATLVCAGFPCQDVSGAGKQLGFKGSRTRLFRELLPLLSAATVKVFFLDNVVNLLKMCDEMKEIFEGLKQELI